MKFFVVIAVFIVATSAQRPSFAGSGPKSSILGSSGSTSTVNLNSRFNTVDSTSERIPIDARGDVDLVNRIKTWPRENWPYWYVNAEVIEKQRGTPARTNVGTKSSDTALIKNRFGGGSGQIQVKNKLSFDTFIDNKQKTYEYDPLTDAWYAKKN
ncbi:uncharacterized protein LOC130891924 [Diorhabda carinulata]|uniref:uncharacterized protein LOC130891924 n=1 Tax=Diorhabda carinulata TaxID=1163345 RepID=UPI0025A1DB1E|nr:uncharacterized protein LOC130891924 [Diorhabda carinulata]